MYAPGGGYRAEARRCRGMTWWTFEQTPLTADGQIGARNYQATRA